MWVATSGEGRYGSRIDTVRQPAHRLGEGGRPVAPYDTASFAAGQNAGTRIASCIARLAAGELMDDAHWWNRRRRGAMASALLAHAHELESDADLTPTVEQEAP
jgi:hypothetical protein